MDLSIQKQNIVQENIMERNWYALYTMPRTEKKVEQRLLQKNIEVYLPLIDTVRIWTDRKKKIQSPLIPSFIFIYATDEEIIHSLNTTGVLNIVRYLKKPAKIREYEINNLKILLKEPDFVDIHEPVDISEGEDVEVIRGVFTGLVAKCIRRKGKHQVIIEIKALEKKIEVNVPLSFLQKKYKKFLNL
jgi:transcription antitermination factor NusG